MVEPLFFATPQEFGDWLAAHHAEETELSVGFWKRGSGKPSMTWPEVATMRRAGKAWRAAIAQLSMQPR